MKNRKFTILIAGFLISTSAFAQSQAGNGGGAQYCPKPIGTQLAYEAYDLWDGRHPVEDGLKLDIPYDDGVTTKQEYLDRAISKVSKNNKLLAEAIKNALVTFNANVKDKGDVVLNVVPDTYTFYHDPGCQYYQLVNWVDGKKIQSNGLNKEIILRDDAAYKKMDFQNQAANDFHEAVYKVRRMFNLADETGSLYVRRFVAQVFSNNEIDSKLEAKIGLFFDHLIQSNFLVKNRDLNANAPLVLDLGKQGQSFSLMVPASCTDAELSNAKVVVTNVGDELRSKTLGISLMNGAGKRWIKGKSISLKEYGGGYLSYLLEALNVKNGKNGKIRFDIDVCGMKVSDEVIFKLTSFDPGQAITLQIFRSLI